MTNSKNKGNSFERKIANILSAKFEHVTGIKNGWRRAVDSGSFFGASNQKRTETHDTTTATFGDIISPKNFKYNIECKFYKTPPSFSSIVKGKLVQWDEWIAQAKQDSKNAGKHMLIVIKYNNVDEIVFVEHELPIPGLFSYGGVFAYRLSDFLTIDEKSLFDDLVG